MKKMPKSFENKLRRYNRLIIESVKIDRDIQEFLEKSNIPYEHLVATADPDSEEPNTEALAFINNGECEKEENLKDAIERIRQVYEYFVNK